MVGAVAGALLCRSEAVSSILETILKMEQNGYIHPKKKDTFQHEMGESVQRKMASRASTLNGKITA